MKYYYLIASLLLAGCHDKNSDNALPSINTLPHTNTAPLSFQSAPSVVPAQQISLINQHQQENTKIYPYNSAQLFVDQTLKALTAPIQQDLLAIMGTELQSVDTNFNKQRITFQYQVWQINKKSVCSQAQLNAMQFSECTQAAKQLFQTLCNELKKQNPHPRNQQLQRMYCQAAVDFKPTIAHISHSQAKDDDKTQALRKKCNDLIFKAKISENIQDEKARDRACQQYKKAANFK